MKRYELLILTALVLFVFSMLCPPACVGSRITDPRARKAPRVEAPAIFCEPMREKFFVKSRCEGYLAVDTRKDRKSSRVKNKVILQRVGINDTHPSAMVVKETCVRRARPGSRKRARSRHLVRYKHEQSDKYICFDQRGNVRAVDSRRVERKGRLCMFEEKRVDASYHILRSAHNAAWHLDFNPERRSRKGLAPRRGPKTNQANCHAQFHSGRPRSVPSLAEDFSGIFDQIERTEEEGTAAVAFSGILQNLENREHNNNNNYKYTKAVNNNNNKNTNNNIDVGDNGVEVLSKAHLEALKQQHILSSRKKKYRIRHLMKKNWRVARPVKRSRRRRRKQHGGVGGGGV